MDDEQNSRGRRVAARKATAEFRKKSILKAALIETHFHHNLGTIGA